MMQGVHAITFRVTPEAIDLNEHVNNIAYMQWMQDAAMGHLHAMQWPLSRYIEKGRSWVARSHFIEYLRPAMLDDEITVLTWIATAQGVESIRKYLVLRSSDGKQLARAETRWIFVNVQTGRPAPIEPDFADFFTLVTDDEQAVWRGFRDHQHGQAIAQ